MDTSNPWNWIIVIGLSISALGHLWRMRDIIKKAQDRKRRKEASRHVSRRPGKRPGDLNQ